MYDVDKEVEKNINNNYMEHQSEMGAYGENSNVQNSGNYITIIPVEYSRRGYPIQAEYQYK